MLSAYIAQPNLTRATATLVNERVARDNFFFFFLGNRVARDNLKTM